jgi:hypothetical protein
MRKPPEFHTETPLATGLKALFRQLEQHLELKEPIDAYLAGGMAVHLYTACRVTKDVDVEFSKRVIFPDLIAKVPQAGGRFLALHFDKSYNSAFTLVHQDHAKDAITLDAGLTSIRLHVFSPVDLAVSKIWRFADIDKADISALVRHGLTSADEIEQRATSAMDGYVGNKDPLILNLRDALALAREAESGGKSPA